MGKETALVISAIILGTAIILHGGIYEFYSPDEGIVHRLNKVTGKIELCAPNHKCQNFEKKGMPERL